MANLQYGADRGIWTPKHGIYETSSNQAHPLGTRLKMGSRTFYYAKDSGSGLTAAELAMVSKNEDREQTVTVAHPVGTKEVTITAASNITASQYADGYLHVNQGTGKGDFYRVDDHPAISSSKTGVVTLKDPLVTQWNTGDTDVVLTRSLFVLATGSSSNQYPSPVGVPLVDLSANEYGWVCTWGVVPIIHDEALGGTTADHLLTMGSGTDGLVESQDAVGEPIVGHSLLTSDCTDADAELVLLQLIP